MNIVRQKVTIFKLLSHR